MRTFAAVPGAEWSARRDGPSDCDGPGRAVVNTGVLLVRPSRAALAHIGSENTHNTAIRCFHAVQDLLNHVAWDAFGREGFVCMSRSLHCAVPIGEDCNGAALVHFGGPRKPWHAPSPDDVPQHAPWAAVCVRAAGGNLRFARVEAFRNHAFPGAGAAGAGITGGTRHGRRRTSRASAAAMVWASGVAGRGDVRSLGLRGGATVLQVGLAAECAKWLISQPLSLTWLVRCL